MPPLFFPFFAIGSIVYLPIDIKYILSITTIVIGYTKSARELNQLKYFIAVENTGSFSKAAKRCYVAQPSLSQQIIKLEKER